MLVLPCTHTVYLWWVSGMSELEFARTALHMFHSRLDRGMQFCCCSVTKLCPTLCDPMNWSTPGFSVLHYLLEFAQNHVRWVDDAIQPSHSLLLFSLLDLNLSHPQGLFQWVGSLHQVAKVLELQHQSFQWIFRVDFLWDWHKSVIWSPTGQKKSKKFL